MLPWGGASAAEPQAAAGSDGAAASSGLSIATHLVHTDPGSPPPPSIQPLAVYDGAVLASLTAAEATGLARAGIRVTELVNATWIDLPGYRFDTRQGEPALPPALRAEPTDESTPYIVQFVGPLHVAWRERIAAAGGRFARYGNVNNHAWIVLLDGAAASLVSELPFVRWVGRYHPAFRLSDSLTEIATRPEAPPDSAPITVLLQVFATHQLPGTIEAVTSQGGKIVSWGPTDPDSLIQPYLTVEVDPSLISHLAGLHEVAWLQERPLYEPLAEQAAHGMQSGACGLTCNARTVDDLPWWRDGVTGAGPAPSCGASAGTEQIVGVMDSGIDDHPDFEACPGPGCTVLAVESQLAADGGSCGNAVPVTTCFDGHGHGTAVAGVIAGSGAMSGGEQPVEGCSAKGLAFGGRLDVEPCGPDLECVNLCDANATLESFFQRTYDRGSRLSNHSWGAAVSGAYDALAQTVDTLAWDNNGAEPGTPRDYLWAFAAGNEGPFPGTLRSPGTAKDIVSVAAVYNGLDGSCWSCDTPSCTDCDKIVCYSSRGPNLDGRHGPHIAGLSQCITAPDLFGGYNGCFNGTSAATPTVTATAAQIRDWWIHEKGVPEPSGALVKATLLNSGEPIQDPATTVPDEHVGWGRVELDNLWDSANPDLNLLWLDETNGVTTGGLTPFDFTIRSGNLPLRIMLVWTDYPATAGVGGLVNDLDLLVREPDDAACYRGNDATGNDSNPVSCTAPGTFDATNNDEGVRVTNPAIGSWTVEVRATNVPQGPQPFALVVSGDLVQCPAPPPPPTSVAAAPAGPNAIGVSWSAVPGAVRYFVYRSDGACPGGTFQQIGSVTAPQTSFTDTNLSGGSTYSYFVQALNAEGCISTPSACSDAVATGDCTLAPTFAGLQSVTDDGTGSCGLTLGWNPATSKCPLFDSLSYNVYRSTDPGFQPGPATLRSACVNGTSYADDDVSDGVAYHYVVRAEDSRPSGGNGACHGGNQESNTIAVSGSPTGDAYVPGIFLDDGGDTGPSSMIADDPWFVTFLKNRTPGGLKSYRAGDWLAPACAALRTPVLRLDPAASTTLTYWTAWDIHWYEDIGVVEISTDGGGTWSRLTPSTGYPKVGGMDTCLGSGTAGYGNVNYGQPTLNWIEQTIDLSAYQGQDVIVRFLYATDYDWNGQGWWLDDISVTGVLLPVACTNDRPACSAPPDFDGARAVSRDPSSTCSLTVSWDAAQSRCGLYPELTYSIYRGTDPTFVPDASNRVASCLSGTSWSDPDVFFGRSYYYVVRAEDSATGGSGPCNGGNEDPNLVRVGSTPGGPSMPGIWKQDAGDLESQQMLVPGEWSITDLHNGTPGVSQGYSYWASTVVPYPAQMCSSLTSPPIELGGGSTLHFSDYEALDYYLLGPDGGIVEVSADGGWTWERLNDSSNSSGGGYDYCSNGQPMPMFSNWILDWRDRQIPIPSILDNRTVQFRFRFVSDDYGGISNLYEGWFLDDIAVDNVQAPTTCQNPDPACDVPPVFTGAIAAVNDGSANPCSVTVTWAPAEVTCGAYPTNTYSIYRGTDPDFVPGPANMIATCVTGTSYVDTEIGYGQTFYYAVRAEDSSTNGDGPCNGGNQEDNSFLVWDVPSGPSTVLGTWIDDAGDTYAPAMSVPPEWSITTYNNHTQFGSTSYQSAAAGSTTYEGGVCASITSPPLTLGTDSVLSFWSWDRMDVWWVDAGIIEVSNDGGITWTKVSPYNAYWNNYPITTPGGGNDCIGAYQRAFGGFNVFYTGWEQWFVDLGPGTFPPFPGYDNQTIQIRFRFGSRGPAGPRIGEGWFIDDIQVTNVWLPEGCMSAAPGCASRPAFRGAKSVSTGTNPCTLTVEWDPGVAGCAANPELTYSVYKDRAPGFVPGPANLAASCLPGPWFTDSDVSFGIPEYYVARAEDSRTDEAGVCNGGMTESNMMRAEGIPADAAGGMCVNMQPTCADPPVFPGLEVLTNNQTDPCSVTLSWSAAASRCMVGPGVTYSIYRSDTPGFVPSWQNRIASCVTQTTYTDTTTEGDGTYYYVIRSEDSTGNGTGPCNSGNLDPNAVEMFVRPSGAQSTLIFDDFEVGLGNWTPTGLWTASTDQAWSGTQSASSEYAPGICEALTLTEPIVLPTGAASATLSFRTMMEVSGQGPVFNIGTVEISADGGPWTKLEPIGGYPDVSEPSADPCTGASQDGFGQNPTVWTQVDYDLAAYLGRSIQVRFLFGTSSFIYAGTRWYVDDVEIRYGGTCDAYCPSSPATPAAVTATPTGSQTVSLSWDAVPGTVTYDVLRSPGGCPGTAFESVATVPAPATTFLDTLAGGGGDWSYQVVAQDAAGCRSGPSTCIDVPVAGACTIAPTFAGLESAINSPGNPCGVHLDWSPARGNCPTATDVTYSVYRGTTPGFTPGPATLLADCVTATSFDDFSVDHGTLYSYVVRAEDGSVGGAGACNGGNQEGNLVEATAVASGGYVPGSFVDSAGDGLPQQMILEPPWNVSLATAVSGSVSYHAGESVNGCASMSTPPIRLDPTALSALTFWSRHNTLDENRSAWMVEASNDGGATWTILNLTPIPLVINNQISCLSLEAKGYEGYATEWVQYAADLLQYQGQEVVLRFRYGTQDPDDLREGWFVDDIRITSVLNASTCQNPATSCTAAPFFDGVKSASDDGTATCGISLAWDPASPACSQYPDVVYNVYRDTDPDFVPGPSNLVASCLDATTYADVDIAFGTTFYYTVRAEDGRQGGGSGTCGTGIEEANIVKLAATPSSTPPVLGTWFDDAGDTVPPKMVLNPMWFVSNDDSHSGVWSYFAPKEANRCDNMLTPPLTLGTGSLLTFWSEIDVYYDAWTWGAGTIEITSDGGNTWTRVEPLEGYPDHYNNNILCDVYWEDCFGRYDPWSPYTVDLSAYANETVQIRFHFTSHDFFVDPTEGWHIDDIALSNVWLPAACTPQAGCPLAVDVLPDAAPLACAGDEILFSANVSGGTPPYTYQWTEDGVDIPGATGVSYASSRADAGSHTYNCRVTDGSASCGPRSDPEPATGEWIDQCAPDVVYDATFDPRTTLGQVCGDGDAIVEPGERWSSFVRLANTGTASAGNVRAALATNAGSTVAADVVSAAADFGAIAPGQNAMNFADRFEFCPAESAACGGEISFDVTEIDWSGGGSPPGGQASAFAVPVGVVDPGANEWADLTPSPIISASANTAVSDFQAVTIAAPDAAVLAYGIGYSPPRVPIFEDEFDTLAGWNRSGVTLVTTNPDTCPGSLGGSNARMSGGGFLQKLIPHQHTQVRMEVDHETDTTLDPGEFLWAEYKSDDTPDWTPFFQGPAGGGDGLWHCGETFTFPPSTWVSIKFRSNANAPGEYVHLDSFRLTGLTDDTWDDTVRVEIQDTVETWHMLKDFGVPDANPYDLLALGIYNGPGIYRLRLSENAGGSASLSTFGPDEGLNVGRDPVSNCDVSSCCAATTGPPPVGDGWIAGGTPVTLTRNGNTVTYTYDATSCSSAMPVVVYGNLGDYSGYAGVADCDGDGTFDATGLDDVWFNVIWVDASNEAGHPGYATAGPRNLSATGVGCGIVVDNPGDGRCD